MKHLIIFICFSIIIFASSNLNAQVDTSKVYTIVEEMPSFRSCDTISNKNKRRKCTDQKLIKYIYQNIYYPDTAKMNNIQGLVVAQIIINKTGQVTNVKIIRDIGGGCGNELLRVLNKMNEDKLWTPGRQGGQIVRVKYTLPIRFRIY